MNDKLFWILTPFVYSVIWILAAYFVGGSYCAVGAITWFIDGTVIAALSFFARGVARFQSQFGTIDFS